MTPKRRTTDILDRERPVPDALSRDRLTPGEATAPLDDDQARHWGDLLGFLVDQARSKAQPSMQPSTSAVQPRRPPALTPARREALTELVSIPRHRWPAACSSLQAERRTFEAVVEADGRSIRVRCTAEVAATLHPYATEAQR